MLPKSPHKAVNILKHLWNQMYRSPRKRTLMDRLWSNRQNKEMGRYMYLLGKYKNKKNVNKLGETVKTMTRKYSSLRSAWRHTNFHWSQFQKYTKLNKKKIEHRKYVRKLDSQNIESIRNFYSTGDSSFPLPDKKYAGKRFLKCSLAKSCKMYNLLPTTTRKISESTFRKYKPKFVKLQGRVPFRQSCCEVCQNFEFVMNFATKHLTGVPGTLEKCVDSSMCNYETYFPNKACVFHSCSECGVEKLKLELSNLNSNKLQDKRKRFLVKKWENKTERVPGTGKNRTYIHWKHDRLSYSDLLSRYVNMLDTMAKHCFFAAWNFHQYLVCKNNLEEGYVLIVHDSSE